MLVVISPAKRLAWPNQSDAPTHAPLTLPAFHADALRLTQAARALSVSELQELMNLSDDLAVLNHARFQAFSDKPRPDQQRSAISAFAGDANAGLNANTLDLAALEYAGTHLRILSGLYGLLRPLDGIQAYRLEMGCRLVTSRGATLYEYWGNRLSRALMELAAEHGAQTLINCASVEYFAAIPTRGLKLPVITPVFLENRGGPLRIVSFFAKKARGALARHVIENRLTNPDDLASFATGGYRFMPDLSEGMRYVFLRDLQSSEGS